MFEYHDMWGKQSGSFFAFFFSFFFSFFSFFLASLVACAVARARVGFLFLFLSFVSFLFFPSFSFRSGVVEDVVVVRRLSLALLCVGLLIGWVG